MRHTNIDTEIGTLTVTADGDAVTGVYFPKHWYPPTAEQLGAEVAELDDPLLAAAASELRDYLAGRRDGFDVPIDLRGDEFERSVWAILHAIPYGATTTYGAIAARLGNPALAQRVGQAVGHNPISVIVPCHRVIGANGKLTGYAGGLERKQFLLALERPEPVDALF